MPIIGVTAFRDHKDCEQPRMHLNEAYVKAVIRAGGTPLLIPVGLPDSHLKDMLARLDGLIITGGGDINPAIYGASMHPTVGGVDELRDNLELALAKLAADMKKPLLGICRGFEIINVAFGGTLYTHIADQLPNALHHPCYTADMPRDLVAHTVSLKPGSKLAQIIGMETVGVNSLHHQGVERVGKGLKAIAHAPDSLVEGLEIEGHPFGIGVQWHPEAMPASPEMQNIFTALIQATGG